MTRRAAGDWLLFALFIVIERCREFVTISAKFGVITILRVLHLFLSHSRSILSQISVLSYSTHQYCSGWFCCTDKLSIAFAQLPGALYYLPPWYLSRLQTEACGADFLQDEYIERNEV